MTEKSSYYISKSTRNKETAIKGLEYQVKMMWPDEKEKLMQFGLQDGSKIFEPGNGPGFITKKLLELYPNSHVTAVEIDPMMIELQKEVLAGFENRYFTKLGSVYDTGLPENEYDVAIVRLLLQHLPETEKIIAEFYRVLKPSGKLIIIDVDDGVGMAKIENLTPEERDFDRMIHQKFQVFQSKEGGNRFISRYLPKMLLKVGFMNVKIDSIISHTDLLDEERKNLYLMFFEDNPYIKDHLTTGVINQEEYNKLMEIQDKIKNFEDKGMVFIVFITSGEK
ncbi:MAG: class I SAM-dependent methyltransferase [Candidatus Heimdallarchaeota archaeon]|nr:class I SAM-dependent methyltransferase [Candidatus Heimdallarchaeota archaeon]